MTVIVTVLNENERIRDGMPWAMDVSNLDIKIQAQRRGVTVHEFYKTFKSVNCNIS